MAFAINKVRFAWPFAYQQKIRTSVTEFLPLVFTCVPSALPPCFRPGQLQRDRAGLHARRAGGGRVQSGGCPALHLDWGGLWQGVPQVALTPSSIYCVQVRQKWKANVYVVCVIIYISSIFFFCVKTHKKNSFGFVSHVFLLIHTTIRKVFFYVSSFMWAQHLPCNGFCLCCAWQLRWHRLPFLSHQHRPGERRSLRATSDARLRLHAVARQRADQHGSQCGRGPSITRTNSHSPTGRWQSCSSQSWPVGGNGTAFRAGCPAQIDSAATFRHLTLIKSNIDIYWKNLSADIVCLYEPFI